jgi:hypothetical protein
MDKVVLEAGSNAALWWFVLQVGNGNDAAYAGDPNAPVSWPESPGTSPIGALRISFVPQLLGLTGINPDPLMQVDDATGTNRLFYTARAGMPHFDREYVVDRVSGHLSQVRVYNDQGVVMLRSELSNYKPVNFADGVEKPAKIPEFPHHVKVFVPARHLTVTLDFNQVTVLDHVPPAAFEPPDMTGKNVQRVD